ncbi:MAG: cytochrome c3 family protein, partial [Thermodesulfobacteriota bacterium]|nr:cytochrome c3 family protein [Thermodesulfobacteriota bacterium]
MLFIGIIGYSWVQEEPEVPVRILYKTNAGKVLFDHKTHTTGKNYASECVDCHHEYEEGEELPVSCAECHEREAEELNRAAVLHSQCKSCHEAEGRGPVACGECHRM